MKSHFSLTRTEIKHLMEVRGGGLSSFDGTDTRSLQTIANFRVPEEGGLAPLPPVLKLVKGKAAAGITPVAKKHALRDARQRLAPHEDGYSSFVIN